MEKKENNTLLAVSLASVLAFVIGFYAGHLSGKGYESETIFRSLKDLAQGKDPRETLVVEGAEQLLREVSENM